MERCRGESFDEIGRDVAEGLEMARRLEKAGFDSLHVDAGCYESHYWPHPPIYQKHGCMVNMAGQAKAVVTIPVIGVGRLDKPEAAARAVKDGMADVAAIGRGFLADPEWADKVKSGRMLRTSDPVWPVMTDVWGAMQRYGPFPVRSTLLPAENAPTG